MQSYDVVEWGKPLQAAIRETPVPIGTEVLVRIKFCGVCHSDVHIRDGYFDLGGGKKFHMSERGMKLPVTLGHRATPPGPTPRMRRSAKTCWSSRGPAVAPARGASKGWTTTACRRVTSVSSARVGTLTI